MNLNITIEPTLHRDDQDGALFVRYVGVLENLGVPGGRITGPCHDCEVGAPPADHESARQKARTYLVDSIAGLLDK